MISSIRTSFHLILTAPVMLAAACSSPAPEPESTHAAYSLDNPMNVEYLETHLEKQGPRLVLNSERENVLRSKLETDPLVQAYYATLKSDAERILQEPFLEREIYDGTRMLAISQQMVSRLGTLGMVYHLEKDPRLLERIDQELITVSNYEDWNPSHYLDTGEMSLAVSLGLDWAGEDLPASTVELAQTALIEKGLRPSFSGESYTWWIDAIHNWNQVVHGGLVAAAITVAEREPELAANTLSRALDKMGLALAEYGPDGVYPEGATYWDYGTMYSVITSSMLSSAFGTDFGLAEFPGFLESADFRLLAVAPTSEFFNFFDTGSNVRGDNRGVGDHTVAWFNRGVGTVNLAWFAAHTGNSLYFDPSYFEDSRENRRRSRFDGPAMVWLTQYEPGQYRPLPLVWKGDGVNPLVIFRGGDNDPEKNSEQFYLGAKGGRASINHGNMDAGSFVFELDGVRWSVDPGNQSYAPLEQAGFNLWSSAQDSERWLLLTKGNHGHSTLTVNDALHRAGGYSALTDFNDGASGEHPEATFGLTGIFESQLQSASRRFVKEGSRSLLIEDKIQPSGSTETLTWQMMTTASVEPAEGGAVLKQDGKVLNLDILSPAGVSVSVIPLDPPPMELDKHIEGLKRIEIRVPAAQLEGREGTISVRLSGNG
ncbi:MAG: heparinase II/III family protein [Balneolales bacterium]